MHSDDAMAMYMKMLERKNGHPLPFKIISDNARRCFDRTSLSFKVSNSVLLSPLSPCPRSISEKMSKEKASGKSNSPVRVNDFFTSAIVLGED